MRVEGSALLVAFALVATVPASAQTVQDCHVDRRVPLTVSPASGAPNTSLNAPVLVRYAAGYFGPDGPGEPPSTLFRMVACARCGSPCDLTTGMQVPGLVQTQGDVLVFQPDGGLLSPSTQYVGRALGADGQLDFRFCTGSGRDTQPPSAAGIGTPTSTHVSGLSCLADGYRIAVYFTPSTDDGPPGSIEYLLFETRGEGIDAPVLVDRVRNFSAERITMSFLLASAGAATPVCLQVVTVDGAGHASVPEGDRCFDPIGRTTFQGCAAGGRGSLAMAGAFVVAALALARRRR